MMNIFTYIVIVASGFILVCYALSKLYLMRRTMKLSDQYMARMLALAKQSLESLDVPISALLIYRNEIIGEGCNTVLRTSDAGGHAEINAISNAIQRMGMDQFSALDRASLFLVTTFEPCLMCTGAFMNYNIKNVYFIKEKDTLYLMKEAMRFIRYYFRRGKMNHTGEQDVLFEQHPLYPLRKVNATAE
jgi:tRNA(Arg) A34 adenosine deaminase TadA